jgi:hypothetical protein
VSIHSSFAEYEKSFIEFGYEDSALLSAVTEQEFANDLEEMGVKKNHRRLILKAFVALSSKPPAIPSTAKPSLTPPSNSERSIADGSALFSPTPNRKRDTKKGVKIEVEIVSEKAVKPPPQRLASQGDGSGDRADDGLERALGVVGAAESRHLKAEAFHEKQTISKIAFAASQNVKAQQVATKHKIAKELAAPAALKAASMKKLGDAHERKQELTNRKLAFSRSDSLKAEQVLVV